MSALAVAEWAEDAAPDASARSEDAPDGLSGVLSGRLSDGLATRLFAAALAGPQRTLLRDSGDRVAWCGRPSITWTYAAAAEIVGDLRVGDPRHRDLDAAVAAAVLRHRDRFDHVAAVVAGFGRRALLRPHFGGGRRRHHTLAIDGGCRRRVVGRAQR